MCASSASNMAQSFPLFFGALAFGHVDVGSDYFKQLSAGVEDRMAHSLDVPHGSVGQHDSELLRRSLFPRVPPPHEYSIDSVAIFGMDPLLHHFEVGNALLRIEAPNRENFPQTSREDLRQRFISPTPCVGQLLRFRQISLAAAQRFFGTLAVLDIGARAVPPQDAPCSSRSGLSRIRNQRYCSVFPPYSCLHLKSGTVGKRPLTGSL